MLIIGVVGRKRHGKDTVAKFLRQGYDFTPISFADPIKRICSDLWGFSYDQLYGDLKEVGDPRWGSLTPRHAMQQLGTEVGRCIYADTWIDYAFNLMREARQFRDLPSSERGIPKLIHLAEVRGFVPFNDPRVNPDRWVIPDVRFPNEAAAIHAAGGLVVRVVRPQLLGVVDEHPSETAQDSIRADYTFTNEGSLEALQDLVDFFMKVVQGGLDTSSG